MATIPADVCKKLAKLLPLLASDKDGEVVATAAAITRMLTTAECDWHDLSDRLTQPAQAQPQAQSQAATTKKTGSSAVASDVLQPLIDAIRDSGCYLSRNAEGFLDGLEDRAGSYAMVHFTEKQWSWFLDLLQSASVKMQQPGFEDFANI